MFLREQELDDKVRALEIKLAYLEGVLYMLLVSLPVFVFLILRTIFTPFYPQHFSHYTPYLSTRPVLKHDRQ